MKFSRITKKVFATVVISLCFASISVAQDYSTGIGVRGGLSSGLTIKHFIGEKAAFEGILSSRWRGFGVTGLYEIHNQAFDEEGFKWYYGFGGHIGFYDGDYAGWGDAGTTYSVIGVDGILGLEYSFTEIPFNVSIDWKPAFNLYGHSGFWGDNGALSVRYIF
ncbi:MAG: hypothetical protein ACLFMU_08680 [Bacteroidales bacterium]